MLIGTLEIQGITGRPRLLAFERNKHREVGVSSSIQSALIIALFVMVPGIGRTITCDLKVVETLPDWIAAKERLGRWVDIAECIQSKETAIERAAAKMKQPNEADGYRYSVAQGLSNAIESGPLQTFDRVAASRWNSYLAHRSNKLSVSRLNQAVRKLIHHGRKSGLDQHISVILTATKALGSKQYFKTGNLLLSTLYRCDSWDKPKDPSASTVCNAQCRPYFNLYLTASESIENLRLEEMTPDQPKLIPDIHALKMRLTQCDGGV
jgi:hypothetical protein